MELSLLRKVCLSRALGSSALSSLTTDRCLAGSPSSQLERVNLAAFELLNPDQAASIETAQGELAETRKTLAAREKETEGAAAK